MGQCCSSSLQKFSEQDYSSIRTSLLSDGSLWCDPTFPASNHLLPASCQDCVWLRPKDICEKLRGREREEFGVPEMGCRSRQNVNQGEIGNCWFLSVLAGLAENKHLFDAVVPPGQGFEKDYCGLFRFRFYRLGVWYEVVIDDRLPTRNGHLVFLRGGQPNQFWPALFEKAYAKFYGGYHNIEGGNSVEAGVDFSGGISQKLNVSEYLRTSGNGPEKLLQLLQLAHDNGALITCTLGGTFVREAVMNKLIDRHAYTVTGMCQVKGGRKRRLVIPLVRLRDPHGAGTKAEWEGDWSDDSKLWKEISSRATNTLRRREKDGEFYVSFYKDFLRYFDDIDVIHINPLRIDLNEDRQTREFGLAEWKSEWRTGIGANRGTGYQDFHRNPQFNFTISNCRDRNPTCTIVVSLTQELDNRKQNKSSIGFKIYKSRPSGEDLDGDYVKNSYNLQCDSGAFTNSRDVSGSFLLPAGSYTIIPGTFDTQDCGGFFLRLFVDNRWWCETSVPLKSVTDYSATARNAAWWKSLWRTLLHCRCCCYCCCPTVQVCNCCCQHSGTNSDDEPYSSK